MDKKIQILLGSQKNINSVNVDTYDKVELFNNTSELMDYDVNDAVSSTEVFDAEREANPNYRIYGRIEYLSLLNNIKNKYTLFQDFLTPQFTGDTKNISSFDFYLVRPASSGYAKITGSTSILTTTGTVALNPYIRQYEVIATPADFELFNAGFSNNTYNEQVYAFNFKKDYDVSKYFDNFNFPATELFLYAKYKPTQNGNAVPEHLYYSNWGTTGIPVRTLLSTAALHIGDKVYGDIIDYNMDEFTQTQISGQTYYISTVCTNSNNQLITLVWKYDPFTSLRLAYFSNELSSANTGTTSYDVQVSIPAYATHIDNKGNVVWRDIQPQGYTDPLTGVGVDYPFINLRRYLFSKIILSVIPDLTDNATKVAFNLIWFTRTPNLLNVLPNSNLNNIGKPCQ